MIIFLNGSINAGKSTVAKILAERLPNVALVEIDLLRDMIGWMPIEKAVPINWDNAVSIIKNFVKQGLSVIVPYPLSQKNYDYIMPNLKGLSTDIYIFTLAPSIEKVLTNRGSRELDEKEKERIKYHYDIGIPNPVFGEIIDNSDQTPKETADYILSKVYPTQFFR